MPGRRYISADSDTGAPSGEKTTLNGSEYFPISGSQVAKISAIRNYVYPFAQYSSSDEVTIANAGSGIVPIDSATFDDFGIGNLVDSDDKVTLVEAGWYSIEAVVGHYSNGGDYDGTIFVGFASGIDNTGETRGYVAAWTISSDELEIAVPIFHATVDGTSYVQISIVNNSGQSIQGYLNRLSIKRLKVD